MESVAGSVGSIESDPKFRELEKKRGVLSWTLTILMLLIYYGFILLIAFAPQTLATKISDGAVTSIGLPIGIAVILSAVVLTGLYVWRANSEFDRLTREIVEDAR